MINYTFELKMVFSKLLSLPLSFSLYISFPITSLSSGAILLTIQLLDLSLNQAITLGAHLVQEAYHKKRQNLCLFHRINLNAKKRPFGKIYNQLFGLPTHFR